MLIAVWMTIFKRIEVWLLLLLIGGAVWFVGGGGGSPDSSGDSAPGARSESPSAGKTESGGNRAGPTSQSPADPSKSAAEANPRFRIEEWTTRPESGGRVISLSLFARNDSPEPLVLDDETVRLLTGDGTPVGRFFLPFDAPPAVEANGESTAELRYWLEDGNGKDGSFRLEIGEERLELDLGTDS